MNSFTGVKSFLLEKFWSPVINEAVYYNPYNTVVYSLLFALAAIYLGYPFLKRLDIELNRDFFIGIAPYVFLGGALRSLKDINILDSFLIETPFIYILMFLFTTSALLISTKLEQIKDMSYHKTLFTLGIAALIMLIPFYSIQNFSILYSFSLISLAWITSGYLILKFLKADLLNFSFTLPIAAHLFDATSTYVGLSMAGASEKHVLANYFIQSLGPWSIFLVKTAVIVPVVYYVYTGFEEEDEKRNYYLFLIALLGFAITTRNMLIII